MAKSTGKYKLTRHVAGGLAGPHDEYCVIEAGSPPEGDWTVEEAPADAAVTTWQPVVEVPPPPSPGPGDPPLPIPPPPVHGAGAHPVL